MVPHHLTVRTKNPFHTWPGRAALVRQLLHPGASLLRAGGPSPGAGEGQDEAHETRGNGANEGGPGAERSPCLGGKPHQNVPVLNV